ncbi:alpha/beta hydrolase [Leifsonia sp. fls2-241-R2A-40a]|uniref:alpha/beta fold hydrolase n=1 Tax=Leifsonia sp. fls2-241-R2A-40a TaxID=3040290 RepID=UPI00254E2DC0|nr:alpha/beta hydrolase [Leifsonia sp. fls2-241-R2A-40a]
MSDHDLPTLLFVHGAYAESASWTGVVQRLPEFRSVAVANPLRSVATDADYLAQIIAGIEGRVLVIGHSYGGMVMSQGAARGDSVVGLVYVAGFAPAPGESAGDLAGKFPGGTLGETLVMFPLGEGVNDTFIDQAKFHRQFAEDLSDEDAAVLAVTQRPITDVALNEASSGPQAWQSLPSWFVFGERDRNIPVASHRFMAERARARRTVEVPGASHVVGISHPDVVADLVRTAATES